MHPPTTRSTLYRSGLADSPSEAGFVVSGVYPRRMIGDLHQTDRGWMVEPPRRCINGHGLGANRVTVAHEPCSCTGGHMSWTCRECLAVFYWPPETPTCTVLNGPGLNRPPI